MWLPLVAVPSSPLSHSWSTSSDLKPDPWRCFLGLLLLGEVLLLGVLLGGPLWLVEVALISSSKEGYVSVGVLNKTKVLTLACVHMAVAIAKRTWGRSATEF